MSRHFDEDNRSAGDIYIYGHRRPIHVEQAIEEALAKDRRRCAHYLESLRDSLNHMAIENPAGFALREFASEAEEIRKSILDGSMPSPFYLDDPNGKG